MENMLLKSIEVFNAYRVFFLSLLLILVVAGLIREALRDAQEEIDDRP